MPPPLAYYNGDSPYPPNHQVVVTNPYIPLAQKKEIHNGVPRSQPLPSPKSSIQPTTIPRPRAIRPLNVNEALQFSPLSSIVPFDSGIIALPDARIPSSQSIFSDLPLENPRRQQLEYLDEHARNGDSGAVRNALGSVQSLLDPTKISEFKFNGKSASLSSFRQHATSKPSKSLSPFAAMVLEHTEVAYTTPGTSEPESPQSTVSIQSTIEVKPFVQVQIPKKRATPVTPSPTSYNQKAVAQNETIYVSTNRSPSSHTQMRPAVLIPSSQLSSHPSEYRSYGSAHVAATPKKRKREVDDDIEASDQRAVSDGALQVLKDNLWEVFDAADNFETIAEGGVNDAFLTSVHGSDGDFVTLTASANIKLELSLHKVISMSRFKDIPADDVARIQKLAEGGLVAADTTDVRVSASWADEDVSSWLNSVEVIEAAFRSARTVLRTMTGGREEKNLYPEEILQKVISLLTKVTDSCLTKVVESRSSGESADVFRTATSNAKVLSHLLHSASKVMNLLFNITSKEELSETPVNDILFFAIRMLFVENSPSEKESVLGIHKFEAFRRSSMNIISQIYTRYEDQREFIIREVLESLQKLPTTKQHARQYKLPDGTRLQLTSVLLIRLVSTSGTRGTSESKKKVRRLLPALDQSAEDREGGQPEGSEGERSSDDDQPLSKTTADKKFVPDDMRRLAKVLYDAASHSAQRIINFLVYRASTCSKTGEQPHRHLLDMFVEDLVSVLGLPDWPASELLLRALVGRMIELAESSQSLAPAKNMALELLGVMGSAVLDVTARAKQISRSLDTDDTQLSEQLSQQLENSSAIGGLDLWEIAGRSGPYRIVLEYLSETDSDVQGYHLTQWIKFLFWGYNATSGPAQAPDINHVPFATKVCKALANSKWSEQDDNMAVSQAQCRLAYHLVLLNVAVCRAFGRIVNVLVASFKSDQVTVRARSLKSVTQLLEKDPSLLDRTPQINNMLQRCLADQSSMVRDNALALLGKCITFKANIDADMLKAILAGTRDTSLGIKKRAMKLLKDIYLRETNKSENTAKDLKAVVSESLLYRVDDPEDSVSELGRQMVEDIWISPFWPITKSLDLSVQGKVALKAQMHLITQTIERTENNSLVLRKFLRYCMSQKNKAHEANVKVNKAFVTVGFESIIDDVDESTSVTQRSILQTMTVFAQANASLFSQHQLEHLKPYIGNLSGADDLNLFRRVVVILRCVLPTLSSVQKDFLKGIQDDLFKNVAKLAKAELNEVTACLWTINGVLANISRLVNLEVSVLNNLHKMEATKFQPPTNPKDDISKAQRFIYLAGHFGHHCDFEPELEIFQSRLPWLREDTVAGKIVTALKPFFADHQPLSLRTVAMEGIGMVCQAWPQNFNDQSNVDMFQKILRGDHRDLQKIVLSCFRNFFAAQDPQFSSDDYSEEKPVLIDGKIGGTVIASDKDSAAALIAQGFYKDVNRISLSSQDDYALTATEVMASIVRQGLVHPKECGPALVALTTSANTKIAAIALQQHQILHLQHESMFEREYMRAIHLAYQYQKGVNGNTRGFTKPGYRAKLHSMYEVIKTSKSKVQSKFLANYCSKIDFDMTKLDISGEVPSHLDYARFLIENLALFDYTRMEDLLQVITTCEKIVSNTGSAVAHAINTDIFKMIIDPETGIPLNASGENGQVNLDVPHERLKLLTTASMVLSILWQARTFVRRLFNMNNKDNRREGRGRPSKDQSKIPPKNNTVTGDKFTDAVDKISHALESPEHSLQQCKEFAELMAIDSELKVADEGDEDEVGRLRTPSIDRDGESVTVDSASKLGKRKSSVSLNGTPHKKKRGRPSLNGARRNSRKSMDDDDDWD